MIVARGLGRGSPGAIVAAGLCRSEYTQVVSLNLGGGGGRRGRTISKHQITQAVRPRPSQKDDEELLIFIFNLVIDNEPI